MEGNNNNSPISQFFDNKTVFITGATGFMGKVSRAVSWSVGGFLTLTVRFWWRNC